MRVRPHVLLIYVPCPLSPNPTLRTRVAFVMTTGAHLQVKGQMYGNSFHPDPEIYMANQHVAFGVPQLANATPIPAAS